MDSATALLDSVQRALKGNAELKQIVGTRIYGATPENPTYPFVFISCASAPFSSDDTQGMEHTLRVQGFAEEKKPGIVLAIRAAVFAALNRQEVSLALPNDNLVMVEHDGVADVFPEPDGKTYQSIIEFKVLVD